MKSLIESGKAFAMLEKEGVPVAKFRLAKSPASALKAAFEIGFPVAVKLSSKKIVHKSEAGAVKLNIKDEKELESAVCSLEAAAKKAGVKPEGFLVQKMEKGIEVMIGLKKDSQFGNVVVFGLGGIFVEIYRDISMRLAPLKKQDCIEMVNEIKGSAILKGARGQQPADLDAICRMLMAVSKIGEKHKSISEMDLNPVMVNENGAVAVDARIIKEG